MPVDTPSNPSSPDPSSPGRPRVAGRPRTYDRPAAPRRGRLVRLTGHAETIAVLRREVIAWSPDAALLRDPMQVDTSLLASGRCDVTTAVAGWLRTRVLGDATATGRPGKARALRCSLHLQARAEPRLLGGVGSATRRNRPGSGSLSRRQVRHGRPPDAAAGGNARAAHRRQAAPPPRLLAKITAVEGDPPRSVDGRAHCVHRGDIAGG